MVVLVTMVWTPSPALSTCRIAVLFLGPPSKVQSAERSVESNGPIHLKESNGPMFSFSEPWMAMASVMDGVGPGKKGKSSASMAVQQHRNLMNM